MALLIALASAFASAFAAMCSTVCDTHEWTRCIQTHTFGYCRMLIDMNLLEQCAPRCCLAEQCHLGRYHCGRYMGNYTCTGFVGGKFYMGAPHNIFYSCLHCNVSEVWADEGL